MTACLHAGHYDATAPGAPVPGWTAVLQTGDATTRGGQSPFHALDPIAGERQSRAARWAGQLEEVLRYATKSIGDVRLRRVWIAESVFVDACPSLGGHTP